MGIQIFCVELSCTHALCTGKLSQMGSYWMQASEEGTGTLNAKPAFWQSNNERITSYLVQHKVILGRKFLRLFPLNCLHLIILGACLLEIKRWLKGTRKIMIILRWIFHSGNYFLFEICFSVTAGDRKRLKLLYEKISLLKTVAF